MRYYVIIICAMILGSPFTLHGQTKIRQTPEEQRLQVICDCLCRLTGRKSLTVIIKLNEETCARTDGQQIHLSGPNCYNKIMQMSPEVQDDAFAAVIGHELSHKLVGQDGSIQCFSGTAPCGGGQAECDMDFYGLMLAHLGGYDQAVHIWDQLVGSVLDVKTGNYDRKKQDEATRNRVTSALEPFELGNYLSLLSDDPCALEAAIDCYETCRYNLEHKDRPVPAKLNIRQIDYQIGLIKLKKALHYAGIKCQLPLETVDPSFLRLERGEYVVEIKNNALVELDAAEQYLSKSRDTDPNWPEAHLALLCVDLVRSRLNRVRGAYTKQPKKYPAGTDTNTELTEDKWRMAIRDLDAIWTDWSANKDCSTKHSEGSTLKCPLTSDYIEQKLTSARESNWNNRLVIKHYPDPFDKNKHPQSPDKKEFWSITDPTCGITWLLMEDLMSKDTHSDNGYTIRKVDHNQHHIECLRKHKKYDTWIYRVN